jgi:uncharacterized protein (TIGR02217 family)
MIDYRITDHIGAGAIIRPKFSTEIVKTDGGFEVRNSRWSYPLHEMEFDLSPGVAGDDDDLEELRELFYAAGGAAESFKFRDRFDYQATDSQIGIGDGGTIIWQLVKTYTRGALSRTRKITRPVAGTVVIKVNGAVAPGATVNYATSEVSITPAVGIGQIITATFEFDIPVRFADDSIDFIGLSGDLQQPVSIMLEEIRE